MESHTFAPLTDQQIRSEITSCVLLARLKSKRFAYEVFTDAGRDIFAIILNVGSSHEKEAQQILVLSQKDNYFPTTGQIPIRGTCTRAEYHSSMKIGKLYTLDDKTGTILGCEKFYRPVLFVMDVSSLNPEKIADIMLQIRDQLQQGHGDIHQIQVA